MRVHGATGALGIWCFALFTRSMAQMNNGRPTGFLRENPDARFASRMLSLSDVYTTMIPMVGIGFFPPNDAADVLPPANNSELIEELEDDERVTVQSIELGELLCESLVNAENAPALQFALRLDEVITAKMKSYTEYNGSIFADGIMRKVWTGEVVHDQEEVSSQTASMTWGEECDVETFLLEVPTKFVNGTLIVSKTIPCKAGEPKEICVVELELELPDEPDPEVSVIEVEVSENDRRLRDGSARSEEEFKLDTETGTTMKSIGRQLQSTTQIDLMLLYTPGGRDILGVSDSQMQSELADYVNGMNTAMENSYIDLQFSLVRVEPLPYTEESIFGSVVLENLETNSDVAALRNTYGADLIQLVTDLNPRSISGICGLAHLPSSPNEAYAFSLVDPYCFFQFSHTHEVAHNMGCYHDRDNSDFQHEYAHGYRYCDGDLPYRTIMALACVDEDGFSLPVNRLNFFSNPDKVHNGRPTGTVDNNCARRLKETMGDVASYRDSGSTSITPAPTTPITSAPTIPITLGSTTDPMTCSNGITGVERDGICCTLGCVTCGGSGCYQRAREAGLTPGDCCITVIEESGVYCEDSGTAPCIFGEGVSSSPSSTPGTSPQESTMYEPTSEPLTTDLVEAGERTTVVVKANGHDERTSDNGCAPDGCRAENTRDGSLSTRWSCKESLLGGVNCEITFEFSEPQDLDLIRIAFYKGTERTRKLKVKINGSTYAEIVSSGQTDEFEVFEIGADDTSEVTLEALELGPEDWIALTEVQLIVP